MQREKQVMENFSQIATSLLARYSNDIAAMTAAKGKKPAFDELMGSLSRFEKELTGKAVQLAETYKNELGDLPDGLSDGLKQIISGTIRKFIKTL